MSEFLGSGSNGPPPGIGLGIENQANERIKRSSTKRAIEASQNNTEFGGRSIKTQPHKSSLIIGMKSSHGSLSSSWKQYVISSHGIANIVKTLIGDTGATQEAIARGSNLDPVLEKFKRELRDAAKTVDADVTGLSVEGFQNLYQHHRVCGRDLIVKLNEILVTGQSVPEFTHTPEPEKGFDGQSGKYLKDNFFWEEPIFYVGVG